MIRVLFVCMGNICRSPTAEGVFRKHVTQAGLTESIEIDSAGTHAYHVGEPPDSRAQEAALRRGIDLSSQRGRKAIREDFARFDYVLAMDSENFENLKDICPATQRHKLRLFLEFAPNHPLREVPDPYFGGNAGFDKVLDMIEEASQGLLDHIKQRM
jgi:protein-tyrosine phosphatase